MRRPGCSDVRGFRSYNGSWQFRPQRHERRDVHNDGVRNDDDGGGGRARAEH